MKKFPNIIGTYTFTVYKNGGKGYVAEVILPLKHNIKKSKVFFGDSYWTQGRTKKEVFEMVSDLIICVLDL